MRHRVGAAAALAIVLAGAACDAPTIPARDEIYDFGSGVSGAEVIRWPVGSVIRTFVAAGDDSPRADLLRSAFARGAGAWEAVMNYGEFEFSRVDRAEVADLVLRWSDVASPLDESACPPALGGGGVTTFCLDPDLPGRLRPFPLASGGLSGARMLLVISASEAGDEVRVRRLVAHELGHVLGLLRHSSNPDDLMWSGRLERDTPSRRDRETIHVLYHVAPDVVP